MDLAELNSELPNHYQVIYPGSKKKLQVNWSMYYSSRFSYTSYVYRIFDNFLNIWSLKQYFKMSVRIE